MTRASILADHTRYPIRLAMRRNNQKRWMAFSSHSQASIKLLAVLAGTPQSMASLVYQIVEYSPANLAGFGVVKSTEQHTHGKVEREDLSRTL
jgi:NADH:ubiquinone oxidoreductase subunit 2 (chain N)